MSDSYWDDPAVKASEAEYEAAVEAKASAAELAAKFKAFDDAMDAAKRKLNRERGKWKRANPGKEPPWRGAGGDDVLVAGPKYPLELKEWKPM